jgi:hypothetical protein
MVKKLGMVPWTVSYEQGVAMMNSQNNWESIMQLSQECVDSLAKDFFEYQQFIMRVGNNVMLSQTCNISPYFAVPCGSFAC